MKIEKAVKEDVMGILSILEEAKGIYLSEDEKEKEGFIQGEINADLLLQFINGLGVYVARNSLEIAGVVLVSRAGVIQTGPAGELYKSLLNLYPYLKRGQLFLYGPVAIKRNYRDKGIFTLFLRHICLTLENNFILGAAFVDINNEKSLQIHRHYPMQESGNFVFNEKVYQIFILNPSNVLNFYKTKKN